MLQKFTRWWIHLLIQRKCTFLLVVISFTIMVYLTISPQHSGLRIPLVSICVFDRNWEDVIIARKNAGETDFVQNATDVQGNEEQFWEPHLDWDEGSGLQHDKVQRNTSGQREKESRPHRPDQLQQRAPHHCRQRSCRYNTCVYIAFYDQFSQQCLLHPVSTFQCCRIILLFLHLFIRQNLDLESSGTGNFQL